MLSVLVLLAPLLLATSSAFVSNNNLPTLKPKQLFQTNMNEDVDLYLYSFDSALSNMVEYKSKIAIQAAIRVWPSLLSVVEELGMQPYDDADSRDDYLWLIQKLGALSSLTQQGDSPDEMLGCDEVLLTRMLLEEQLLDDGRSNGRGGKYGGKFHPGISTATKMEEKKNTNNNVGSRPLTVGEIYANWSELRYVTHNKYPFLREDESGKVTMHDPLPEIRRVLCKLYSEAKPETDEIWHPFALDILRNRKSNNVVLLGNEASLSLVLNSLTQLLGDTAHVTVTNSTTIWSEIKHQQTEDTYSLLLLLPDNAIEETQSALIRQIIMSAASDEDGSNRNIYVAGSLDVLKKCKGFLGEDPPILSNGLRRCAISIGNSKTSATLFLPSWTKNVHPTQRNEAAMDPWLNVASEELLEELASAVIV